MARGNEPYRATGLSGERQKKQRQADFQAAIELVKEILGPRITEVNVQPPTEESLTTAGRVGVQLGRAAHAQQLGGNALTNVLLVTCADYVDAAILDQNFTELQVGAYEAFTASNFTYVEASFPKDLK